MPFKPTLLSKRPYSKVARTGIGTSSVHELLPLPKRTFYPFSCCYFQKLIIVTIFLLRVTSTQFMLLIFKDVNWRFSWITISNDKYNLYNFCTHFQMCTPIHASTMWVAPMGSSAPVLPKTTPCTIALGSLQHHLTTPSNWPLPYLTSSIIWRSTGARLKSLMEKVKMIRCWVFLVDQDAHSSYKQVVNSWC